MERQRSGLEPNPIIGAVSSQWRPGRVVLRSRPCELPQGRWKSRKSYGSTPRFMTVQAAEIINLAERGAVRGLGPFAMLVLSMVATACVATGPRASAPDALHAPALPAAEYKTPAAPIVDLLTATRPAEPLLHAGASRVALLTREPLIPLARLERPFLGLAGYRFDPVTGTSNRDPLVSRVEVVTLDGDGQMARVVWQPAAEVLLDHVQFSPDGRYLSATAITDSPARLVVFDVDEARESVVPVPINAAWGTPCWWVGPEGLLCRVVPEHQGAPPELISGPRIIEHPGGRLPTRTYSNLIENARDEVLFSHYFTSELAFVDLDGALRRLRGSEGLVARVRVAPDGSSAVVSRLVPPFSRVVPARRFPHVDEVWDLAAGVRAHALPRGTPPPAGFPVEPRALRWRPGPPAVLGWIETQTGADGTRQSVWRVLDAPFTAPARDLVRTSHSIDRFDWTTAGTPFFASESKRKMHVDAYVVLGGSLHAIWSGSTQDLYGNPGRALRTRGTAGQVYEVDGRIFLAGDGLSPAGPEPFLDSFELSTLETRRLFTSTAGGYEPVLGLLATGWLITSHESETDPPTLYARRGDVALPVHPVVDPFPQLAAVERRLVEYRRKDGVRLEATLYLPPEAADGPLPTLVWIYPYEFVDRQFAEQSGVRRFRFHAVKGPSPLAVTLAGYALLLSPTMPIIGEPGEANDQYLTQLAANAAAAVQYVVDEGITDPDRVAIAGRSYGAFSTANLLAHTDLFRTGIAISGAYNRTLTPFGFQREYRSFWKESSLYARISPFFEADRIDEPLLLIHGAADQNAGTRPSQARRFFHALVGNGVPVRYLELPYEGHHYWGRESVLHITAEILDWLKRTLGPASAPEGA